MPAQMSTVFSEPPSLFKEVFVDSAIAITAQSNSIAPKKFLSYGFIASLIFDFTLAIVETTATQSAVPAQNAVSRLTIRDKYNKEILSCTGPQFAKSRKLATLFPSLGGDEYRKGEYDAGSNIGATGGNYRVEFPIPIPLEYQPVTYEYTLGVLTDLHSTVGDATATLTTRIMSKSYIEELDPEQKHIMQLRRFQTYNFSAITAEESYQNRLMDGMLIYQMMIDMVTDAQLTDATVKAGGSVGFDRMTERNIAAWENRKFDDGHTPTGTYVLPLTRAMVKTDQFEFKINPASSTAPTLYLAYRLPKEEV